MFATAFFAAAFAVQAVGMYNQYQTQKELAEIQKEKIDIQRQEQELQEKIRKRKERAKQRKEEAALRVRAAYANNEYSSTFRGQIEASQSSLEGTLQNIEKYGNLQQAGFDLQEDAVEAQEPTTLDLALNIGSAAVSSYSGYKSYKGGLASPTTSTPSMSGGFANEKSTYSMSNSPFGR